MPTGRKPIPAESRAQRGDPVRPLPVVIGGKGRPDKPSHLSGEMGKAWDFIVDALVKADVIGTVDAGVLEAAATFWGRAQQARKELAAEMKISKSLMEITPQGRVPNRLLDIERNSWKEFRALAESLPLSPWGRARLGLKSKTAGLGSEADIGLPPRLRAVGE